MSGKHYYWLKLSEDFFRDPSVKKLRQLAGGDTFTVIYLKMLLLSLSTDGKLYFDELEDDFSSQIALEIDEDVENVRMTVAFLLNRKILLKNDDTEYELTTQPEMCGSETESARKMRRLRQREKLALETHRIESIEERSHCDHDVTECDSNVTKCDPIYSYSISSSSKSSGKNNRDNKGVVGGKEGEEGKVSSNPRKKHGENGWVRLTDEEYNRLLADLGEEETERCIGYIDESAQITGNKNKWKDWNRVIRKCSREGWGKGYASKAKKEEPKFKYDYGDDDIDLPF